VEFFLINQIYLILNFLKMFFDIIKFYKKSDQVGYINEKITLGEYLKINKLSKHLLIII
jgi:predicted NAD/FAD-binding protein